MPTEGRLGSIIASLAPGGTGDDPLTVALEQVLAGSRAVAASVYLLELRSSTLELVAEASSSDGAQSWPQTMPIPESCEPRIMGSVMEVPVCRRSTVLAMVVARSRTGESFNARDATFIGAIGGTASVVFAQRHLLRLVEEVQTPVDFHLGEDEFYEDLGEVLRKASQAPAGALREIVGTSLVPVLSWGTGDARLEFGVGDIPEFEAALTEGTQVLSDLAGNTLGGLLTRPPLDRVRSAVLVPVRVGNGTWGIISFALHTAYDFSAPEIAGFEMVANGAGVSIENFRNYNRAESEREEFRQATSALTANDLIQMARHETRELLGSAKTNLLIVRRSLKGHRLPQSVQSTIANSIDQTNQSMTDIANVLDRMKVAAEPPRDELKRVVLTELWADVTSHVDRSLRRLDVEVKSPQGKFSLFLYRDWFRHALLNLVLNSMEAFRSRTIKAPEIGLNLLVRPHEGVAILTYYDNAGGLDRAFFRSSREYRRRDDLQRLIFEPGVTSKKGGSGFGLYFVRRIISQDHQGSIDLIDDKPGVTFRISVPLDLHERIQD